MTNIVLGNISSFVNDSTAVTQYNANNALITTAFSDALSKSGEQPNTMSDVLDMNNYNIINLPSPATINSPVRLVDVISPSVALTVPPVGTSGSTVPLLNGNNSWSGLQTFTTPVIFTAAPTFPAGTTFANTFTFNGAVTFNGNNSYNGTSTFTKAVTINTATGMLLNITSSNTGGSNKINLSNSGTSSNVLTIAELDIGLSGLASGSINLYVEGGPTPISQLNINSGITGGFNLVSINQLTVQSLSAGTTVVGQTGVGIQVPFGVAVASFQPSASTFFNPIIMQSSLLVNSLTAIGTGVSPIPVLTYSTIGTGIYAGTGVPTFSSNQGSLYIRTDGAAATALYLNTSVGSGTTWVAIT